MKTDNVKFRVHFSPDVPAQWEVWVCGYISPHSSLMTSHSLFNTSGPSVREINTRRVVSNAAGSGSNSSFSSLPQLDGELQLHFS